VGVGLGEDDGIDIATFFAACFAASNFCQSNEFAFGGLPAGLTFASDFNCPFNCRRENGTVIRGAMNSVCTNNTVAKKPTMPQISKNRRRRGQRFPRGSENTKGVRPGGISSGIRR